MEIKDPYEPQSITPHSVAKPMDAIGLVTTGRTGFTETWLNILDSMQRFGFPVTFNGGAYWEQALTFLIRHALAQNRKYMLFFDGDSGWAQEDLQKLYDIIESDPKIDAICPVQADRNGDNPLCYNWQCGPQKNVYDYTKPISQIGHGHFGCTLIRAQVFRDMRLPWLCSVPAYDGSWDRKPGKMDSDTYFWVKFNKLARVAVQANDVVIGHMQCMMRWQTANGVYAQGLAEWQARGKPAGCRIPTITESERNEARTKSILMLEEIAKQLGLKLTASLPENTSPVDGPVYDPPAGGRLANLEQVEAVMVGDNGHAKAGAA